MAAKNIAFEPLITSIRNRNFSPVYILHGEEGYFIDALVAEFEKVLPEDERQFNLSVLYAPRIDISTVPGICQRIPMFSDFQIVILKEAQAPRATDLNILVKYVQNPSPSTVLVIAGRGQLLKGELVSAAKKSDKVTFFESKKIYESQLGPYITEFVNTRGLNLQPKSLDMLIEYIGSDLSRLYNEIGKLTEILGAGATVTPEAIEKHIGFSRSFNAFELVDAIAAKDAHRVFRIVDYFRNNTKDSPLVMVNSNLFNFFSDLLITYFAKDKTERGLMTLLNVRWPIQFKKFANGRKNYNAFQVIEIIRALRSFDRQSKGNGSRRNEYDLFQELMYRILTARGELFPTF